VAIKQIKVGFDNFSYIIYCPKTRKAAIVDPSYDSSESMRFISSEKLDLMYIINTHYHSDHVSDNQRIKQEYTSAKIIASKADGTMIESVDIFVSEKDKLKLGDIVLEFMLTPGHTPGGICIIVDNEALITGDTLFIGDCGRCDLPGGDIAEMFKTLQKIKNLSDDLIVYPGHDYGDKPFDTLGNQKRVNKTLIAKNFDEFSKIP
jgi:glyoxylase-like metal-dependent hydrolase (beta-lactamase superfamily II)